MAGTLTISTLSDGTNSTSSTNCIQGSAKAWVNFNGSGGASIRASYNISSVVRNGTGNYTVNFTTALTDGNYSVSVSAGNPGVVDGFATIATSAPTASAVTFRCFSYNTATVTDMPYAYIAVFR